MKLSRLIGASVVGGAVTVATAMFTLRKPVFKLAEKSSVPKEIVQKVDSLVKESDKISKDTAYTFFGNDTLEITGKLVKSTPEYLKKLDKSAEKHVPKIKTGMHLENQMFPRQGGGFDIIPVMEPTMTPIYSETKAVISSSDLYTTNGKDLFVPVEYYGKK